MSVLIWIGYHWKAKVLKKTPNFDLMKLFNSINIQREQTSIMIMIIIILMGLMHIWLYIISI